MKIAELAARKERFFHQTYEVRSLMKLGWSYNRARFALREQHLEGELAVQRRAQRIADLRKWRGTIPWDEYIRIRRQTAALNQQQHAPRKQDTERLKKPIMAETAGHVERLMAAAAKVVYRSHV